MSRRGRSGANQGIQGNVQAEVLAVGRQARAVKIQHGAAEQAALQAALADLRAAVARLALPATAQKALAEDVDQLHQIVAAPEPARDRIADTLRLLAGKLKMVGVVLTDGVAVAEAIKKMAGLVQLSLKALGIGG